MKQAVAEVASYLGNTPTIAKGSYIDPRIIDAYESGTTIGDAATALLVGQRAPDRSRDGGPGPARLTYPAGTIQPRPNSSNRASAVRNVQRSVRACASRSRSKGRADQLRADVQGRRVFGGEGQLLQTG